MARVSIIIVNWNSKNYVRACLTSLFFHHSALAFEVIVVDGASFDGCGEMLAKEFPVVTFVQSPTNVGFAKANNLGARHAQGDYLFLLNPDTAFTESSLSILLDKIPALTNFGAIGCKLLNTDGSLQTSCVQSFPTVTNQILDSEFLRRLTPRSALWGMAALFSTDQHPMEVEALSGAAILIKRSVFDTIHGFSEDYFMYGEDLDLCFKTKRAGYRVYYTPETSIIHHGGGSTRTVSNFASVRMRESTLQFLQIHRGVISAAVYRFAMALSAMIRVSLLLTGGLFIRRKAASVSQSLQKWTAIFRWSLGLRTTALKI